ncbi:MAG TPA: alpha/beta hydrolase, partial [Saprospiraceae bacterium]|nr:alpha/beta hydrolase [Saprospiraceae bacterium]
LLLSLTVYILLNALMYFMQAQFIFFPVKLSDDYSFAEFPNAEEVFLSVDEERLHALYFKVEHPKGTILYFHGNSGAVDTWAWEAEDFTKRGYNLLMPDFRAYGKSTGQIDFKAFSTDAKHWYDYLRQTIDPASLLLVGRSLGTGIASELASKVAAKMLILETPYWTMADVAKTKMPFLAVDWLLKYNFRNDIYLAKINCPIYILHGTKDELIPYKQAARLKKLLKNKDKFFSIPNGGHNNLAEFTDYQKALDEII